MASQVLPFILQDRLRRRNRGVNFDVAGAIAEGQQIQANRLRLSELQAAADRRANVQIPREDLRFKQEQEDRARKQASDTQLEGQEAGRLTTDLNQAIDLLSEAKQLPAGMDLLPDALKKQGKLTPGQLALAQEGIDLAADLKVQRTERRGELTAKQAELDRRTALSSKASADRLKLISGVVGDIQKKQASLVKQVAPEGDRGETGSFFDIIDPNQLQVHDNIALSLLAENGISLFELNPKTIELLHLPVDEGFFSRQTVAREGYASFDSDHPTLQGEPLTVDAPTAESVAEVVDPTPVIASVEEVIPIDETPRERALREARGQQTALHERRGREAAASLVEIEQEAVARRGEFEAARPQPGGNVLDAVVAPGLAPQRAVTGFDLGRGDVGTRFGQFSPGGAGLPQFSDFLAEDQAKAGLGYGMVEAALGEAGLFDDTVDPGGLLNPADFGLGKKVGPGSSLRPQPVVTVSADRPIESSAEFGEDALRELLNTPLGSLGTARVVAPDTKFSKEITAAAAKHGVDAVLLAAIQEQESNGDHSLVGKAGEIGGFQIMPSTAQAFGLGDASPDTLHQPAVGADIAAAYLADLKRRFPNNVAAQISSYNAGPDAGRAGAKKGRFSNQKYVDQVLARYNKFLPTR